MRALRIPVIFLVFLLVFGVLFLGDHLVYERRVVNPLLNELEAVQGVAAVELAGRGDMLRVRVTPDEDVDLVRLYNELADATRKHLGARSEEIIELVDTRIPLLEQAYQEMRFAIEEAVATGRFTRLTDAIRMTAETYDLDNHAVYIDSDRIYLELESDRHRLLAVIARERSSMNANQA